MGYNKIEPRAHLNMPYETPTTATFYDLIVDGSRLLTREQFATIYKKYPLESRTIRAVIEDKREGWRANHVIEVLRGSKRDRSVIGIITAAEAGEISKQSFDAAVRRVLMKEGEIFDKIASREASAEEPQADESTTESLFEQLDILMILEKWLKDIREAAKAEAQSSPAPVQTQTAETEHVNEAKSQEEAAANVFIGNPSLDQKIAEFYEAGFVQLSTEEKRKRCDEMVLLLLLEIGRINTRVTLKDDLYSKRVSYLQTQLAVVEGMRKTLPAEVPAVSATAPESDNRAENIDRVAQLLQETSKQWDEINKNLYLPLRQLLKQLEEMTDPGIWRSNRIALSELESKKTELTAYVAANGGMLSGFETNHAKLIAVSLAGGLKADASLELVELKSVLPADAVGFWKDTPGERTLKIRVEDELWLRKSISEQPELVALYDLATQPLPDISTAPNSLEAVKIYFAAVEKNSAVRVAAEAYLQSVSADKRALFDGAVTPLAEKASENMIATATTFWRTHFAEIYPELNKADPSSLAAELVTVEAQAPQFAGATSAELLVLKNSLENTFAQLEKSIRSNVDPALSAPLDIVDILISSPEFTTLADRINRAIAQVINRIAQIETAQEQLMRLAVVEKQIHERVELALKSGLSKTATVDEVSASFEPIINYLNAQSLEEAERARLEREILSGEFTQREKQVLASLKSLEDVEAGAAKVGSTSTDIHTQVFNRMNVIIERMVNLGGSTVEIDDMREELERLKKHENNRIHTAFTWVVAKQDLLYGEGGSRKLTGRYNSSDTPFSTQHIAESLEPQTFRSGFQNPVIGNRTGTIRSDLLPAMKDSTAGEPLRRLNTYLKREKATRVINGKQVEVDYDQEYVDFEYDQTASDFIMQLLDDIYEERYREVASPNPTTGEEEKHNILTVNGMSFEMPSLSSGPLSAKNMHENVGVLMRFIERIESALAKRDGVPPRYDSTLIQIVFRQHLMITLNHVALSPDTPVGLSDENKYAIDWTKYWTKERKQGVAVYSVLPSLFLFAPTGFQPWEALGEGSTKNVEEALKRRGRLREYGYLLQPFVSLIDTFKGPGVWENYTSPKGKPMKRWTVFTPPLASVALRTSEGKPRKIKVKVVGMETGRPAIKDEDRLLTPNHLRDTDGRRLYQLFKWDDWRVPTEDDPNPWYLMATYYTNFAKNALSLLNKLLKSSPANWDKLSDINALLKDAKYAMGVFPKIGLKLSVEGSEAQFADFYNRVGAYYILLRGITMLLPEGVEGGMRKGLDPVNDLILASVNSHLVDRETGAALKDLFEDLYQYKAMWRELGDNFEKQVQSYLTFSK